MSLRMSVINVVKYSSAPDTLRYMDAVVAREVEPQSHRSVPVYSL